MDGSHQFEFFVWSLLLCGILGFLFVSFESLDLGGILWNVCGEFGFIVRQDLIQPFVRCSGEGFCQMLDQEKPQRLYTMEQFLCTGVSSRPSRVSYLMFVLFNSSHLFICLSYGFLHAFSITSCTSIILFSPLFSGAALKFNLQIRSLCLLLQQLQLYCTYLLMSLFLGKLCL